MKLNCLVMAFAVASLPSLARAADPADVADAGTPSSEHHIALETGASALGSSWEGDFVSYTGLKLAFRFIDLVGPYAQFRVGYGVVDDRMLTLIALGGQIWMPEIGPVRPFGRLAFVHQHEESLSVVAGNFGSALFGVGDGIRHRAGGEAGLGVDMALWQDEDWRLYGAVEGSATLFPDELGPLVYAGGGLNIGMAYTL